jgi:hypothetical protein
VALTKAITDAGYTLVAIRRTDEPLDAIKQRVFNRKTLPPVDASKHKHDVDGMPGMQPHG